MATPRRLRPLFLGFLLCSIVAAVPATAQRFSGETTNVVAVPDRLHATFQPPPLAAGTYELQVTLTATGEGASTRSIDFVVPAEGRRS